MKKRTILGTVLFVALALQGQTAFAANNNCWAFIEQIKAGNLSRAEGILKSNARKWSADDQKNAWFSSLYSRDVSSARTLEAVKLLQKYNVGWGGNDVSIPLQSEKSEELIRYLINIGMPLGNSAVFFAIDSGYGDNFVQFLLDKGGQINGYTLRKAAEKKRWTLVPLLASRLGEDDMNSRETRAEATARYNSESSDYRSYFPFNYDPISSKTALMFASEYGQHNMVRLLVEKGARVNLRADGGETAASLAYDNGEIEMYNYLKANGAIDYEPRQVAQQSPAAPSTTTNVYVQPSAPVPAAPSEPPRNIGKEIAEAFMSPLDSGTYGAAGTTAKMRFTSIGKSGVITYTTREGKNGTGTYSINGNSMTVQMEGYTLVYTITSKTSFSNRNESWVRTGF